ncbi:MAG: MinD/ParA family ATP-binding protein [Actinomycetota bacterium]
MLAWDNNETRGSLPWRVDHAAHEATILDLLPRAEALLSGGAQFSEVGHFVHHQTADKFDALFSDQSVDGVHVVTAEDVDVIYRVAARYYRLSIMDSGNSERADNWLAMIDHADRLVVPCTNVEDTAEAAARMLESLAQRDERSRVLASAAVVIVSQRNPGRDPNMSRIVGQFEAMGHEVVTIPHDPALVTGVIRHGQLRNATQRAWLSAAAAVARGL